MDQRPPTAANEPDRPTRDDADSAALARDPAGFPEADAPPATESASVGTSSLGEGQRTRPAAESVSTKPVIPIGLEDVPPAQQLDRIRRSLEALRHDLLEGSPVSEAPTTTESPTAVTTVVDPGAINDRIDDIERMMSELLAPESPAADAVPPVEPSDLDAAMDRLGEEPAAFDADVIHEPTSSSDSGAVVEPDLALPEDSISEALPTSSANVGGDAASPALPSAISQPRRSLAAIVSSVFLPPLQSLSSPMAKVPVSLRPAVSALALTLPLWIPGVWWLSRAVASAERVRPLQATELAALSASLQPPSSAGAGHDRAKQSNAAADAGKASSGKASAKDAHDSGAKSGH